jgi:hypothetical protein
MGTRLSMPGGNKAGHVRWVRGIACQVGTRHSMPGGNKAKHARWEQGVLYHRFHRFLCLVYSRHPSWCSIHRYDISCQMGTGCPFYRRADKHVQQYLGILVRFRLSFLADSGMINMSSNTLACQVGTGCLSSGQTCPEIPGHPYMPGGYEVILLPALANP